VFGQPVEREVVEHLVLRWCCRIRAVRPVEKSGCASVAADLMQSHLAAALSAVFPDGERYFVRSV
jgi:predicted metal-dependent hydrolase